MASTQDLLTDAIKSAGKVVADAELPEPLRLSAFEVALDVILRQSDLDWARQDVPGAASLPAASVSTGVGAGAEEDPMSRVAVKAGVSLEAIKEVFSLDDEELKVVVGARRIEQKASEGSRELTLLFAGGRQAAGLEEWTALRRARQVCEDYSRLDSKNYATAIKAMDEEFSFRGQGVAREVRVTMPGWDAWRDLVTRLLGLSSAT